MMSKWGHIDPLAPAGTIWYVDQPNSVNIQLTTNTNNQTNRTLTPTKQNMLYAR